VSVCQSCGNDELQLDLYCPKCRFVSPSAHNRLAEAFIGDLYERGYQAYNEKGYKKATSAIKLIIKLQPDNPDAAELLRKIETEQYSLEHVLAEARLAFQNRRFEEAADKAADVISIHPGHPEAEEILEQSREELENVAALEAEAAKFFSQGEYATAMATLEELVQAMPDSDKYKTQLGRVKEKLSHYDKRMRKAKRLVAGGKPDDALPILEELSKEVPSDSDARTLLSRVSKRQDTVFKLIPVAREAVEAGEYARAQKLLAKVLAVDKDYDEAKELWERIQSARRRTARKWSLIGTGIVVGAIIFVIILVSFSRRSRNRSLLQQARTARGNGEYLNALELYNQIGTSGVDPEMVKAEIKEIEIDAFIEQAEASLAKEAWSKAEQALTEAENKGSPRARTGPYHILAGAMRRKTAAKTKLDERRWLGALEDFEKILTIPKEDQTVAGWKKLFEAINSERARAKGIWLEELGKKLDRKKLQQTAEILNRGEKFFPGDADAETLREKCLNLWSKRLEGFAARKKWKTATKESELLKKLFPKNRHAANIIKCVQFDRYMARIQDQIKVQDWVSVESTLAVLKASNPPPERQAKLEEVESMVADKIKAIREKRFKELCAKGDNHFKARKWDKAAKAYKLALDIIEDPAVERRIAQAKGQAGAPAGMVYIPGGKFTMGSNTGGFKNEYPAHTLKTRAFYIGLTEVTNKEYREFVKAAGRLEPRYWKDPNFNQPNQPVVGVSLEDAKAYAKWKKARLPSEAEWEYAARGADALTYPWGNNFDAKRCRCYNSREKYPVPVGSYPTGRSPWGCLDMAGNVFEWTSSKYDLYPGAPMTDDRAGKNLYIVKGGAYSSDSQSLRTSYRDRAYSPTERKKSIGFRIAKNVVLIKKEE